MIRFHPIIACLLCLGLVFGATPTLAQDEARLEASIELVQNLITRIQDNLDANPDAETIRVETNAIIDDFFAYDSIARFVARRGWRGATADQKARYKAAFRENLLSLAETNLARLQPFEFSNFSATPKGDKWVIVSIETRDTTGEFPDATVGFRIRTKADAPPRIFDIEVENISMLITQQQEYTAILNSNGGDFEALIDVLNEQTERIRTYELTLESTPGQ